MGSDWNGSYPRARSLSCMTWGDHGSGGSGWEGVGRGVSILDQSPTVNPGKASANDMKNDSINTFVYEEVVVCKWKNNCSRRG